MTIDAKNSVRIANSIIRIKNEPPGIVSNVAEVKCCGYDRRLFFCHKYRFLVENRGWIFHKMDVFGAPENEGRNCRLGAENVEKLRNCLAFTAKFYYNNMLYNVVGPWLMQGVAKLRKVAEVVRTSFVYLKLPHIANSKGTFVAK